MEFYEKIYVNDLDGNLLMTRTPIYIFDTETNETVTLTPQQFDQQRSTYIGNPRYAFLNGSAEETFQHFRDFFDTAKHRGPEGFMADLKEAIEKKLLAPSFHTFIEEVLVQGRMFAILTTRGHTADNLCRGFKYINKMCLTPEQKELQIQNIKRNYHLEDLTDKDALTYYFEDIAYYMPVSNRERCKARGIDKHLLSHEKKAIAMKWYLENTAKQIEKITKRSIVELFGTTNKKISVGFSDDTAENIIAMVNSFVQWDDEKTFPWYQYRAYYTAEHAQTQPSIQSLLQDPRIGHEIHDQMVKLIIK